MNHEPLTITKASSELVFEPHSTLWLSLSELPQLLDEFASLREYLQLIPLSLALSSHESAPLSMQFQEMLPAILNWAIEGFQLWYTEASPAEPLCIQQAAAAFHEDQDPLALFLAQSCTAEADSAIPANEFYQSYVIWARASGERPLSATRFAARPLASGLKCTRHSSGRFYHGHRLIPPTIASPKEEDQQLSA